MRLKAELIRTVVRDRGPKDAERFVSILMALDDETEVVNDPQFESEHPRGNGGQFTSKGGETGGSSQASKTSFKSKSTYKGGNKQSASKSTAFHIAKGIESALNAFETGKAKPTASLLDKMEKQIDSMINKASNGAQYKANNTLVSTATSGGGKQYYNPSGQKTYELNPDGTVKNKTNYSQTGKEINPEEQEKRLHENRELKAQLAGYENYAQAEHEAQRKSIDPETGKNTYDPDDLDLELGVIDPEEHTKRKRAKEKSRWE